MENKVEYQGKSSKSLPPGLDSGGDNRKFGAMGRTELKTPLRKTKNEKWAAAPSSQRRKTAKIIKKQKSHKTRGAAEWGQKDWGWYTDYNYWGGMPNWGRNPGPPIPVTGNGSFDKWGNQNTVVKAPMADHGGKSIKIAIWL